MSACSRGNTEASGLNSNDDTETTEDTPTDTDSEGTSGQEGDVAETLVLWLPSGLMQVDETNVTQLIDDNLTQFRQAQADIDVEYYLKAETGTSSLPATLRSAQKVAPGILPDIVLINTQDLWALADLGLVQPLPVDEIIAVNEVYRFALSAISYNGTAFGIPYATVVPHANLLSGQSCSTADNVPRIADIGSSISIPTPGRGRAEI